MPLDDKIKIFDAEDNKLKLLGELLSNDTSRRIIKMLIQKESYTNEISKKLDIRVSLVIHHLKKLEGLGVLEITHKQIVRKGNNHRYFRMVPGWFLVPSRTKEEIHKSGFLGKIFREGVKFLAVGIASSATWFGITINQIQNKTSEVQVKFEDLSTNPNSYVVESIPELNYFMPILLTIVVMGTGLFLIWFPKK